MTAEVVISPSSNLQGQQLVVGVPRVFKRRQGTPGIDIYTVPIFLMGNDGRRNKIVIETPPFEASSVQSFGQEGDEQRSLKMEKGACPWLEAILNAITEQTFPLLCTRLTQYPDRVPTFSKRLLSANARREDSLRSFFSDHSGHWLKLDKTAMIFNSESQAAVEETPSGNHLYKARITIPSIYLGSLGSSVQAGKGTIINFEHVAANDVALREYVPTVPWRF